MSSSYNTWYEQAVIPCNSADNDTALAGGTAQVNIDGKAVRGGYKINGRCYYGGENSAKGGFQTARAGSAAGGSNNVGGFQMFVQGNGAPTPYATTRFAVANNVNQNRAMRATHL